MADLPGVWVVRGGDNNELASQIKGKSAVALGWSNVPDMSKILSRDKLRAVMEAGEPGSGTPNAVGQLFRYLREILVGDYVLTPEKSTSTIHITRCTGEYRFDPAVFGENYPHVRPVEFLKTVPRTVFPVSVRNTLGSTLTVFRADVALPYIQGQLGVPASLPALPADVSGDASVWVEEIEGQARGQIIESLDDIDHHDFQTFVAGLLIAMGYKAQAGAKGKDGGVDILAYRDAFGLEAPRIKVQVKNQKSIAGIADVGYLHGVLGQGESGLFVCTGGFSKDAKNTPFVNAGRVALVDGTELLELILQNYERFPAGAKAMLPLRRIYVPEHLPS